MVDGIELLDFAAFLAADTTDVLAADTTDVFSAAKAADGGSCPAIGQRSIVRPTLNSTPYVGWYALRWVVRPTLGGTPYVGWYALRWMVRPTLDGTP